MQRCRWWTLLLFALPTIAHTQTVRGRVVDLAGKPISLAQVYLVPAGPTATTDFDGAFALTGIRTGIDTLVTRRLGFHPDTLALQVPPQGKALTIRLTRAPTELQPVTASALHQDLPRLFDRMQRHIGAVAFGDELRKKYPHTDVEDVIKFEWKLRRKAEGPPYCGQPEYFLDGVWLDLVPLKPLSDYVRLRDVAAIEVFRSPELVNEPFIHHLPGACAPVILIWTKGFKQHPWGG
jgi:hypothetical protein